MTDRSGTFTALENEFYSGYEWCLNPFLSIEQVLACIRSEVEHLERIDEDWQRDEVTTNIFLLACALSDSADDCLTGKRYDFSGARKISKVLWRGLAVLEMLVNAKEKFAERHLAPLRQWRGQWEEALHQLLLTRAKDGPVDTVAHAQAAKKLVDHLAISFPDKFLQMRIKSPRAFRSQDFTFEDIVTLARKFCADHADTQQPCLIIGLRTAGSYFGPVLRAYMNNLGYVHTDIVTLRPKGGTTDAEIHVLRKHAARGGLAIVVDEPVDKGITLGICMKILRQAGFPAASTYVVFPIHPAGRDWQSTDAMIALNGCRVITMEPEEMFRYGYLSSSEVEDPIRSYFATDKAFSLTILEDARATELNEQFQRTLGNSWHTRLKRAYAVQIMNPDGDVVVRHLIAKSVGYGWNAYQAYFAARSLTGLTPRVLGLRQGFLFSEWVEFKSLNPEIADRSQIIEDIGKYVAARADGLRFPEDPSPLLCEAGLQSGMDRLVKAMSDAYGSKIVARVKKTEIRRQLSRLSTSYAALIDGNMDASEWLNAGTGLLKTDYEDHAMGRMELSITDPAHDLANAIWSFDLSVLEEAKLLGLYSKLTADATVADRLPIYKLLTGLTQLGDALYRLRDAKLVHQHQELSRRYINAWTFSMIHMARVCGAFMPDGRKVGLGADSPLLFLDVDGVIDRHVFLFPTTTQSGIRALALLRAHGFPIFLNTARSCYDVREYCAAYGLQGGVAESGSYIWDATTERQQVLVDAESLVEIERVREALEKMPGVFTNHFYRYSIKAFTFGARGTGGTQPLPMPLIAGVLADVGATTLVVHQTSTDTAITSAAVNKGTGLKAMLKLLGQKGAETVAVGDTLPDLAMFQVASQSFAPAHAWVRNHAILVGFRVASGAYQHGFLKIARDIAHPDGGSCPDCVDPQFQCASHKQVLIDLLGDIEVNKSRHLLRAMLDVTSFGA